VQSQPIPAPAPVPAQTQQAQSNIPAAPAYSSTPPAPASGTPTAPTPGQQAPLAISPPVGGSAQTVPPAVSPTPTYTPPATPVQPQPTQPAAAQPAPGGTPSNAELCRVAQPWEREVYGCDKPAGTQQSTAPAYTAPSYTAPTPTPAPATQPGAVAAQGTIGAGKVDLVGVIFFANGSAALDGRDAQVLQQIAQLHKQYGGVIRVVGNASSRTNNMDPANHEVANFEVSMERAGAVAAMLARYGVAPGAIITEARSDSAPIYHEFMPTGEAGNRRAEIYLEY
jgi:outer membrane protein OmpA-like peptidoglycan-associated protein